ncbi:MAG: SSU ribosomal protein S11p (S14e), partial [uncultured Sphingomonas sp.]
GSGPPASQKARTQEHHRRRRSRERQLQQHHDHHHRRAGQRHRVELGRNDGLQGQPQVDSLRGAGRCRGRRQEGCRPRRPYARGRGQRSGLGPRECASGAAGGRVHDHVDPRRDSDPAQRCAPKQAASSV